MSLLMVALPVGVVIVTALLFLAAGEPGQLEQ
jgi:hypothetical protein